MAADGAINLAELVEAAAVDRATRAVGVEAPLMEPVVRDIRAVMAGTILTTRYSSSAVAAVAQAATVQMRTMTVTSFVGMERMCIKAAME